MKQYNKSNSRFHKKDLTEQERDKIVQDEQKKLIEEKKKIFLSRLDKPNDKSIEKEVKEKKELSKISNDTKIKDINIIEKIKYQMLKDSSEEGKERYMEMLNQINALKESDVASYINELEREYEPFEEEIEAIVQSRKIEDRINKFLQNFRETRMKQINKRIILNDTIRIIDSKFTTTMGAKLFKDEKIKVSKRNVINH